MTHAKTQSNPLPSAPFTKCCGNFDCNYVCLIMLMCCGCIGDPVVVLDCNLVDTEGRPISGASYVLQTDESEKNNRVRFEGKSEENGKVRRMSAYSRHSGQKGFEMTISKDGFETKTIQFKGDKYQQQIELKTTDNERRARTNARR